MKLLLASVLVLLALTAACGSGGDESSGPEGSTTRNCKQYAQEQLRAFDAAEGGYIPGMITVGFVKGTKSTEAATFLKSLGTTYVIPLPFQEFAVVCTKEGFEQQWADQLKTHEEVEWSHREGFAFPSDSPTATPEGG